MESPAPEEDPQVASDQHSNGVSSSVNVEGSQYHEVSTTENIPTKSGYEDSMSGVPFESDRPVSAGTAHSGQFELENPEEAAILASLTAATKIRSGGAQDVDKPAAIGGPLLARPESSDGINPDSAFSFAKASRQQMDFTGTRKGPALNTGPSGDPVRKQVNEGADQPYAGTCGEPRTPS